jgi:hypothetical protein
VVQRRSSATTVTAPCHEVKHYFYIPIPFLYFPEMKSDIDKSMTAPASPNIQDPHFWMEGGDRELFDTFRFSRRVHISAYFCGLGVYLNTGTRFISAHCS